MRNGIPSSIRVPAWLRSADFKEARLSRHATALCRHSFADLNVCPFDDGGELVQQRLLPIMEDALAGSISALESRTAMGAT